MKAVKCIISSDNIIIKDISQPIEPPLYAEEFSESLRLLREGTGEISESHIRELGERLFQRVFNGAALDQYRYSDPAILALNTSGELATLPWELMHDGANWIARTRGIARISETKQAPPEIIPKSGALKILAAISSPMLNENESIPDDEQPYQIDAKAHGQIFRKLEDESFPAEIKLRKHITRQAFSRESSNNYHVLHFVGHGNLGKLAFETRDGLLDLAEEDWIREQITVALRGGLRLVVLNSCHSADTGENFAGVAKTIMETGVPAVIAMQGSVSEPADITFVRNLYSDLAAGKSVDEAVMNSRRAMATDWQIRAGEWATPVLFVNGSILDEESSLSLMDAEMSRMIDSQKVSIIEPWKAEFDPMMTREEIFVGRRRELRDVLRSLDPENQDSVKIVCLHGDPGMGKTAIAIEAAHRMAEWFHDMIWLSGRIAPPEELREHIKGDDPLTRIGNDESLLIALANKIGVEVRADEKPAELRDNILRALRGNRQKLLIIDSMERFADSDLVRSLLINLPTNCKSLINSVQTLEINERQIHIKPMNSFDSILLLRAYSNLKELEIDPKKLGEIIHFTGGHPMAIRMLVSQMITAQKTLDDAIEALKSAEGEIFDYIFQRSFELAGSDGRKIFTVMAIFYPTASRKALQHVCKLEDTEFEKAIKRVIGLSLVENYEQGKRFGLHQLARAEAMKWLERDKESGKYRARAARYFMDFAKATAPMTEPEVAVKALGVPALSGKTAQRLQDAAVELFVKPAVKMMDTELENCLISLDWLLDKGDIEAADNFLRSLAGFLTNRGYWGIESHYLERIAESLKDDPKGYAEAIALLAVSYEKQGIWKDALDCYKKALISARQSDHRELEASILNGLSILYKSQRNWKEAEKCLENSEEIFREIGDKIGEANVLDSRGQIYQKIGRWSDAIQCFEASKGIYERHGDGLGEAQSVANIAACYVGSKKIEKYNDAAKFCEEALSIFADLGIKEGQQSVLNTLGALYYDIKNMVKAMQYYQNALQITLETGNKAVQHDILGNIALIHSEQGEWMESASACLEAFQMAIQVHSELVMSSLSRILYITKRMIKSGELVIPAQLTKQLSQVIQDAQLMDEEMRVALGLCHGVFTMIGLAVACEFDKENEIYKEALELARSLDENTGAALKLTKWLEGEKNGNS
jgi:tetratricopeptide (TPR) repeat protein